MNWQILSDSVTISPTKLNFSNAAPRNRTNYSHMDYRHRKIMHMRNHLGHALIFLTKAFKVFYITHESRNWVLSNEFKRWTLTKLFDILNLPFYFQSTFSLHGDFLVMYYPVLAVSTAHITSLLNSWLGFLLDRLDLREWMKKEPAFPFDLLELNISLYNLP